VPLQCDDPMQKGMLVHGKASGAAGAFNHYYERDLDREMRRTRSRPFASGAFQPSLWWPISFLALLVASLALAAAANGLVSSLLVFLGSFTYGVVYTVWLKRRSAWNIVIGGLAGSFAVLAGAAAVDPTPQVVPVLLALVLFLWTPPHFWSLAAAKGDDYARAGVPMLPVTASQRVWTWAILLHYGRVGCDFARASLVRPRPPLWARRRRRRRILSLEKLAALYRTVEAHGDG
jgi:heme o synthase